MASRFLWAFAKLRKVTISFVMVLSLSFCVEQLVFHWKDFHEIVHKSIFFFENLAMKLKFH